MSTPTQEERLRWGRADAGRLEDFAGRRMEWLDSLRVPEDADMSLRKLLVRVDVWLRHVRDTARLMAQDLTHDEPANG